MEYGWTRKKNTYGGLQAVVSQKTGVVRCAPGWLGQSRAISGERLGHCFSSVGECIESDNPPTQAFVDWLFQFHVE